MILIDNLKKVCGTDEVETMIEENKKNESLKGRGEMILAIEDEESLRDYLQTILEENGHKVLLASDGKEGLQIYMEHVHEISLVLLDMGLPGIGGAEVLAKLVTINPKVKVISVSGYIEPEVQSGALENGAVDFLPKPYLMGDLLTKVHRTLQRTEETTR